MNSASGICPLCGVRLPAGTPGELCPWCVTDEEPAENGVRVLGDCELYEEIGRGGMGVVWRGRQRGLDREVAVKTLPGGDLAGAEARARFRIEAQASARLKHPNIVGVYDVGEDAGMPYFVMELVRGRTLGAVVAEQLPPPRTAARWLHEAALAVEHAHRHGVLHRDLKPSNILLESAEGGWRPRVTDFGLAKLTDTESGVTLSGSAAGSPAYMPPEQARGAASTAQSDVYGLGAVLYTALTGRAPFQGESVAAILAQVEREEPIPPGRLQPSIPRDLETVCLKCLEKQPARRYDSARALADDLQRFLNNEPVRARPVGVAGKAARWAARRPALAAALSLTVLALVATAAVSTVAAVRIDEARDRALTSADSERRHAAEARRRAVDLHVAEANRRQEAGDFIGSLPPLVAALRAEPDEPARRAAHATRLAAALRQCPRVLHHWTLNSWRNSADTTLLYPGRVYSADFSPDGKWIACATMARGIHFWNTETGADEGGTFPGENVVYVKFSGDGRRLLTGTSRNTISLWDVEKRALLFKDLSHQLNGTHPSSLTPPAMDHRAARIVRLEPGTGLFSGLYAVLPDVSPGGGTPLTIPLRLASGIRCFALSPDGSVLAVGVPGGGIALHETISWAPFGRILRGRDTARAIQFSPDGTRLAVLAGTSGVDLWKLDADPAERMGQPVQHGGFSYQLAWSPGGERVASAAFGERGSFVLRADSGITEAIVRQPPGIFSVSWSPDSRTLVTGGFDNAARFFDPLTGDSAGVPLHHGGYVSTALYSPDGSRVFTGAYDGTARLWDIRTPAAPDAARDNFEFSHGRRWLVNRNSREGALSPLTLHHLEDGTLHGVTPPARCGGVAEDGRMLLYTGEDRWQLVKTRDGAAPEVLSRFKARYEGIPAAKRESELTPDGRRALISADRITWTVFDLSTPEATVAGEIKLGGVCRRFAFSLCGRLFACVLTSPRRTGSVVVLWDVQRCVEVCRFETPEEAGRLRFSPDSRFIAWGGTVSGLLGASARVHRCDDGQPVTPYLRHRGDVMDMAFSPDSRLLATGCEDGRARLWQLSTGAPAGPELEHRGFVECVTFSRDGSRLVTLTTTSGLAMRVWETATGTALTPPVQPQAGTRVALLSGDGTALIAAGSSVARWPLADGERTTESLVAEAEFLSARRHDATAGERAIPAAELKRMAESQPQRP